MVAAHDINLGSNGNYGYTQSIVDAGDNEVWAIGIRTMNLVQEMVHHMSSVFWWF